MLALRQELLELESREFESVRSAVDDQRFRLAEELIEAGDFVEAIGVLRHMDGSASLPIAGEVHVLLGRALMGAHDFEAASSALRLARESYLEAGVRLDEPGILLAELAELRGDHAEAQAWAHAVLACVSGFEHTFPELVDRAEDILTRP